VNLFLWLLFGHLIGDFFLQVYKLWRLKRKNIYFLLIHVFLYSLSVTIVLYFTGLFAWWKPVILAASHFTVDYCKCYVFRHRTLQGYIIDQAIHIAVIVLLLIW